ncbi:MAG: hypothetical protein FWH36_02960 [Lentimicrobiaceae bacterium]|nr:hypothetical protein [Lentimicrobiaceae bacterium]
MQKNFVKLMKYQFILKGYLVLLPLMLMSCGNFTSTVEKDLDNNAEFISSTDDKTIKHTEEFPMDFGKFEILNEWLKRGINQKIVIDSLGTPSEKGEDEYWGGTGTYVQEWKYKNLGLILDMESDELGEDKKVFNIEVISPSSFITSKGIGIGSSVDLVLRKYAKEINKENSEQNIIIIGSIYEGTYFFVNEDKVSKFIIGTLAD